MNATTNDMMARTVVSKRMDMIWAVKVKGPVLTEADHKLILILMVSNEALKYPTIKKQIRNRAENNRIFL